MSTNTSQTAMPRYHSLDSLRAIMMLLGLVLHSSVNYLPLPDPDLQVYLDAKTSSYFSYLFSFIHSFRIPTFFVIAGFFAAYLCDTRGTKPFLSHRMHRIGIPLACSMPIIFVMVAAASYYAQLSTTGPKLPEGNFDTILDSLFMHLWFLYYLLIFCVVAIPIRSLIRRMRADLRDRILNTFARVLHRPYGLVLLAAISGLTLYPMTHWMLDYSSSPFPPLRILTAYAVFFTFGWLIFKRREVLEGFKPRAWEHSIIGLVCQVGYQFFYNHGHGDDTAILDHFLAISFLSLSIWSLIYGFLGLFLRYLERPSPYWRYMSDASYWMYIIHMPITIALPPLLADYALPSGVKFSFVLSVTTVITVVTYHYFVRGTFIGNALNGRRYPRVAPWRKVPTT